MDELRSCDSILSWMKKQVAERRPISPDVWLDAAQALNSLIGDENDKLIEIEHELAKFRADEMDSGKTGVAAKIVVEASPLFKEARKQRAKIDQIKEAIRLAKKSAQIKSDELRNNL